MNKQEQIERMLPDVADAIEFNYDELVGVTSVNGRATTENLLNKGYRKQEDVAREIFAEIEKILDFTITHTPLHMPFNWIDIKFINYYNKLKKKYGVTEE